MTDIEVLETLERIGRQQDEEGARLRILMILARTHPGGDMGKKIRARMREELAHRGIHDPE